MLFCITKVGAESMDATHVRNYIAPLAADILIVYSLRHNQAFVVQFAVNYIGQSLVMESENLLMRTVVASHLAFSYLNRFVTVLKQNSAVLSTISYGYKKHRSRLDFNGALDVAGLAYIGLSWLLEFVMRDDEQLNRKRQVRAALAMAWVLLSLRLSVGGVYQ